MIYCHSNSGSRVECLKNAKTLLKNGFGLCCFDFSGSGCSGGEYVTLGYNESEDLKVIITFLKESGLSQEIFLWGRSMGAATVLLYNLIYNDPNITGLILDSPYSNLRSLALEIAQISIKLPKFMLNPIINSIEKEMKKKVEGLSLDSMDLVSKLKKTGTMRTPAYFITSLNDTVVPAYHVEELKKLWGKEGILKYINAKHYENREDSTNDACLNFMKETLERSQIKTKRTNSIYGNQLNTLKSFKEIPFTAASRIKLFKK